MKNWVGEKLGERGSELKAGLRGKNLTIGGASKSEI
jgi:hypothetical protein